jgi:glycerol-3-phosphate dehydrogenase (NAD(P)+)
MGNIQLARSNTKIAVIGYGSWATALVTLIVNNNYSVFWWIKNKEDLESIQEKKKNPRYLKDIEIPFQSLTLSCNLNEVIQKSKVVIFAIPSPFLHQSIQSIQKNDLINKIVVSAIKGFETNTKLLISEYFDYQFDVKSENFATISGPTHAEEVAKLKTTFFTIAAENTHIANRISTILQREHIYTYISEDVAGVEYAGILKNIYAIAAGIAVGLELNDNFQAVLLTACIRELEITLDKLAPGIRNINHSAYIGDLLVTAISPYSRNRKLGYLLGKGKTAEEAFIEMEMIAEGYYASSIFSQKYGQDYPIASMVYEILYKNANPSIEINHLIAKLQT